MIVRWQKRARQRMDELGLTLAELARCTGVSPRAVQYWLDGDRVPSAENLSRIAKELRVSMDWLWNGETVYVPSMWHDGATQPPTEVKVYPGGGWVTLSGTSNGLKVGE